LPGAEPLPGYRLIERLGSGGFGEVWKCEAPGGLFKAIKFVGDPEGPPCDSPPAAALEREALRRIKDVRHPFILSLERVEVVDGSLVVVMELADRSLHDVCAAYQAAGLPGVPRQELLGYLLEAAEALDVMNFEHGLAHLDIKPHNLFVVAKHVKVADFGLVYRLGEGGPDAGSPREGGFTAQYAAPEVWRGAVSRHSDQYSLAIVYQLLLTGSAPFAGRNARRLMVQHLTAEPDLGPLPDEDRPALARALSKAPEERFPSCLDFVKALLNVSPRGPGPWVAQPPLARRHPPANAFPADAVHARRRQRNGGRAPRFACRADPAGLPAPQVPGPGPAGGLVTGAGRAGPGAPSPLAGRRLLPRPPGRGPPTGPAPPRLARG
jgi:serine/threonine protein kinase